MSQLYILDQDNIPRPVTWQEYDSWEETIPEDQRCALGRRVKQDMIGEINVITVFLATPIGYFGRKPQLWLTLSIGKNVWEERRYSSHRAAISGHLSACREFRQTILSSGVQPTT
jgi:hypothetical protein